MLQVLGLFGLMQVIVAQCKHLKLSAEPVEGFSLTVSDYFIVQSMEDAWDTSKGAPEVFFRQLSVEPYDRGAYVALVRFPDFWESFDSTKFCDGASTFISKSGKVFDGALAVDGTPTKTANLSKSGIYGIAVANCGPEKRVITGQVLVKNPFGFLSGDEHPRMYVWQFLLFTHIVVGLVWLYLMKSNSSFVIPIHYVFSAVLLFGFFECAACLMQLSNLNSTGHDDIFFRVLSDLASASTMTLSSVALFAIGRGAGIDRPVDVDEALRFGALGAAVLVSELISAVSKQQQLGMSVLILCNLPSSLLLGFVIMTLITSVQARMNESEPNYNAEKAGAFRSLQHLLIVLFVVLFVLSMCSFFYLNVPAILRSSGAEPSAWRLLWLPAAMENAAYLILKLGIMMIFMPSPVSKFSNQYSTVAAEDEEESEAILDAPAEKDDLEAPAEVIGKEVVL